MVFSLDSQYAKMTFRVWEPNGVVLFVLKEVAGILTMASDGFWSFPLAGDHFASSLQ